MIEADGWETAYCSAPVDQRQDPIDPEYPSCWARGWSIIHVHTAACARTPDQQDPF